MSNNLTTQVTIIASWNMGVSFTTITEKLIFHSDRESKYACYVFTYIIGKYVRIVRQSKSEKGSCWGNGIAKSFFKILKVEWVYKHKYLYRLQTELSIFSLIETWSNKRRISSFLGYKTINKFETEMYNQNVAV